ncbi:MAG: hypothetical protein WCO12_00310 [bacterium]
MNTLTSFFNRLEEREPRASDKCEKFFLLLESCGEEGVIQASLCRKHGSYLRDILLCIFGNENRWFTGEEVHHDPDTLELIKHFLNNGSRNRARTFCRNVRRKRKCNCFLIAKLEARS